MNDAARRTAAAAAELARTCAMILGSIRQAAVRHGSLPLGDDAPGRSELDLLVDLAPEQSNAQLRV